MKSILNFLSDNWVSSDSTKVITIILLMLISTLGMSQQNISAKAVFFTNVNDSTTVTTTPIKGTIYYNKQSNKFRFYQGTTWHDFLLSGTTPPAGSNQQVQFNNGGVFGGDPGFLYDFSSNIATFQNGTDQLTVSGTSQIFNKSGGAQTVFTQSQIATGTSTPSTFTVHPSLSLVLAPDNGTVNIGGLVSGNSIIQTASTSTNANLSIISKGTGFIGLNADFTAINSTAPSGIITRMQNSNGNIYFGVNSTEGFINDQLATKPLTFGKSSVSSGGTLSAINITGNINTGAGTGGDVNITSGDGATDGNITIDALTGTAQLSSSGPVSIKTNDQTNATDISITGGSGDIGGNILITAGSGTTTGGNIGINANTTDGSISLQSFTVNLTTVGSDINLNSQSGGNIILQPQGGGHAIIDNQTIFHNNPTLNFPSTAAGTSSDLTTTVTGAIQGSPCFVGTSTLLANGVYTCYTTSTNTVTVRFTNTNLVTALDPANQVFKIVIFSF